MDSPSNTRIDPADLAQVRAKYLEERDKRLTASRKEHADLNLHADTLEDPYSQVRPRDPKHDDVDAVVVGAGFGGLSAGAHLRKQGLERIRLVDKAGDVGGVWYWNRYPGAMCDVESYVYFPLLEETGYIPKRRYSFADEIYAYTQKLATHFDLYDEALFHTTITSLTWNAGMERWIVTTNRGDEFTSRYVVVAHGSFASLKLPAIKGIEDFKGAMFHTSRWDYDYTGGDSSGGLTKLADKTVGIIGTGATAVQVLAPVGESAKQLYLFQRTPSTVAPRNNSVTDPEWVKTLKPGWQDKRRNNFTEITNGSKALEDLIQDGWTVYYNAVMSTDGYQDMTPEQVAEQREILDLQHMQMIRDRIESTVEDPAVAEALKPYYRYLCKRPCFHDDYLPAFNRPNVQLVDTDGKGIDYVTETGVVVDGVEYAVDCLVLATGFDVDSDYVERIGFDIEGVDGIKLSEKWADGPETFHGVMSSGFPNLFILPPNYTQGTATVNFVHNLETTSMHIAAVVADLERRGVIANVSEEAEREYVEVVTSGAGLALLGGGKFLESCTPGRWNNEGDLSSRRAKNANFPGTSDVYFSMLEDWRDEGSLRGLDLVPMTQPKASNA